ncbi:hypothetical protein L7F22_014104 [Adiantum nelumboides]|nr:hypothetical protein [Adiantum nelumboides]
MAEQALRRNRSTDRAVWQDTTENKMAEDDRAHLCVSYSRPALGASTTELGGHAAEVKARVASKDKASRESGLRRLGLECRAHRGEASHTAEAHHVRGAHEQLWLALRTLIENFAAVGRPRPFLTDGPKKCTFCFPLPSMSDTDSASDRMQEEQEEQDEELVRNGVQALAFDAADTGEPSSSGRRKPVVVIVIGMAGPYFGGVEVHLAATQTVRHPILKIL